MVDWKGSLKIGPLKIAPLDSFSLQISLLDTHSWGKKANDQGTGRLLWTIPWCRAPGILSRGSLALLDTACAPILRPWIEVTLPERVELSRCQAVSLQLGTWSV